VALKLKLSIIKKKTLIKSNNFIKVKLDRCQDEIKNSEDNSDFWYASLLIEKRYFKYVNKSNKIFSVIH